MWAFLASAALSAGSKIWAGINNKKSADANADVMDQEAAIQEQQAEYAKDAAYDQAASLRDYGDKYLGAQSSQVASSGVTLTGSTLQAQRESQKNIQKDITRTRDQGDYSYELGMNTAAVTRQKAENTRKYGNNAVGASALSAGGSLLGGFAAASPYTELW